MTFSDEASAVAFYGLIADETGVARFYRTAVDWFNALGFPPEKLSVHGPGHVRNWVSFERADARLHKNGFAGVTALTITSMVPGGEVPTLDYVLTASLSLKYSFAVVVCRSSVITLSEESMLTEIRALARAVKPEYGIGYKRDMHLGPLFYAIGLGQGLGFSDADREEAMRITRWGDIGMKRRVFHEGILRDVYPWNFLNAAQRSSSVGGVSLEGWIDGDPRRGKLTPFVDDLALWAVDEPGRPEVRDVLAQAGIIFDWRRYRAGG